MYADDAAFPNITADGLQHSLDVISETYLHASLIVYTMMSEVFSASSPDTPTFSVSGKHLKKFRKFCVLGLKSLIFGDLTNEIQRCINLSQPLAI